MRRIAPFLVLAGLAVLPAAPASACAQPDEGEPHCCSSPIVRVAVGPVEIVVPGPPRVDCP